MPTKPQASEPDSGVLATIEVSEDGVKLVLLDAERKAAVWSPTRLYTDRDFALRAFAGLSLGKREYADIGFAIVNRLCALSGLEPPAGPAATTRKSKRGSRRRS